MMNSFSGRFFLVFEIFCFLFPFFLGGGREKGVGEEEKNDKRSRILSLRPLSEDKTSSLAPPVDTSHRQVTVSLLLFKGLHSRFTRKLHLT